MLLQGYFNSLSLYKKTHFSIILPCDNVSFLTNEKSEIKDDYKTLYLLHGLFSSDESLLANTSIQKIAEKNEIAIVLPSCGNSFYLNQDLALYSDFVSSELVDFTRNVFPLSNKREDTYIAGFSAGGYGSIRNGLKYSETFSKIASISGFLPNESLNNYKPPSIEFETSYNFASKFFNNFENTDKDLYYLIYELKRKNKRIPDIFMACGKDDFLFDLNESFYSFLNRNKIDVSYKKDSGTHNYDFCDKSLKKLIKWLL